MIQPPDNDWNPDPELLSAYFDGELEGRDEVEDLRARIEAWLESQPDAAEKWAEHQQLQKLWQDTTPSVPSAVAWKQTLDRIDAERKQPIAKPAPRRSWRTAAVVAASVLVLIGLMSGAISYFKTPTPEPIVIAPQPEEIGMLVVALASEVTILRIDTEDLDGVIVGQRPVSAPLELADPGEVCVSCKCPRVVVRQDPPDRPMVWAIAAAD